MIPSPLDQRRRFRALLNTPFIVLGLICLMAVMALSAPAAAQSGNNTGVVYVLCGSANYGTGVGATRPLTLDQNGNLCQTLPAAQVNSSGAGLVANLVVKSSPGQLFSFEVSADSSLSASAWWVMFYDATVPPDDGAVTPLKCYSVPSGQTLLSGAFVAPITFKTGIVIGVSTTGCLTKTEFNHAFISGDFQ